MPRAMTTRSSCRASGQGFTGRVLWGLLMIGLLLCSRAPVVAQEVRPSPGQVARRLGIPPTS